MVVEVDVHPLTSRTPGLRHSDGHQAGPNALMTRRPGDHRVLNPGMDETVPQHVDEADELGVVSCHYPAEAVLIHEFLPVPLSLIVDTSLEGFRVKLVELPLLKSPRHVWVIVTSSS